MRLDKYLKVSRLIKRRTVANEACDNGRISVIKALIDANGAASTANAAAIAALEEALAALGENVTPEQIGRAHV